MKPKFVRATLEAIENGFTIQLSYVTDESKDEWDVELKTYYAETLENALEIIKKKS